MTITPPKQCNKCFEVKPREYFYKKNVNGKYIEACCKECSKMLSLQKSKTATGKLRSRKEGDKLKERRKNGELRDKWILYDSRSSDKKKGLENDLTREFICEAISGGECTYCGERDLRISLDRIDNAIGHLQSNVVPACGRCNMIRGSMPYDAWIVLVGNMRDIRIRGLFGDWTGEIHKRCRGLSG